MIFKMNYLFKNDFWLVCKWTIELIWSAITDDVIIFNEKLKSVPVCFYISLNCHSYRWSFCRNNMLLCSYVLTTIFYQHNKHSWNAVMFIASFSSWITLIQIVTMRQYSIIFAKVKTCSMYLWVSNKRSYRNMDNFFFS